MNIPKHIVLFPDGNRRWAKEKGLTSFDGHLKGYENIINFSNWCKDREVKVLTAFGFSTENWKRSPEEVAYLLDLCKKGLLESLPRFMQDGTKLNIIGDHTTVPQELKDAIEKIETQTANNEKLHLNLGISYGGKWDILNAVKKIIQENIPAEKITEELFESHLSTVGLPAP
ncbi:MAG: polyprenyl diphosphate synthase, partial [Candidatus Paceibacterales bacterium]